MSNQDLNEMGLPILNPVRDPLNEFYWFGSVRWDDLQSPDDALDAYWEDQMEEYWDDCNGWDNWDDWTEWEISAEESYSIYCERETPGEAASSDCLREEMYWKNFSDAALNKRLISNGFKKPH